MRALLSIVIALWAGDGGAPRVISPFQLDAGVCPQPESDLRAAADLPHIIRKSLLPPQHDVTPILYLAAFPSFYPARALQLERYELTERLQLRVIHSPRPDSWRGAKTAKPRVQPVDGELAQLLEDAWSAALARTQHVTEVLEARISDDRRVRLRRFDGTFFILWHRDRGAFTTTADAGTPFGELDAVTKDLVAYVEAPPARQPALLVAIKDRLRPLPKRFASEPCLRAKDPDIVPGATR